MLSAYSGEPANRSVVAFAVVAPWLWDSVGNDREVNSGRGREPGHDPYGAVRVTGCRRFLAGNILSTTGSQMMYLALGWEIYQRTNSKTALGIVGLFQVLPILLFSIPAGHLIDRHDRKRIVVIDQALFALSAFSLGLVSVGKQFIPSARIFEEANAGMQWLAGRLGEREAVYRDPSIPLMLALLLANGVIRSVNQPAKQALLPQLVPGRLFANAASWHSSMVEVSTMVGPAVAGVLLAGASGRGWGYGAVYFLAAGLQLASVGLFQRAEPLQRSSYQEPLTVRSLGRGLTFVWQTKIVLATVTLDLFTVLLGGSVVLLPVFAKDLLACGPLGLGMLRAAPSVGAVGMAMYLAHRHALRRAGAAMLWATVVFGLATIGFGLSGSLAASLVLLLVVGACDNISSIVRQTLVQVLTPDAMRGRVSAVKSVFSSASDGLGALESGFTAAVLGPRLAVVLGGVGTLIVAAVSAMVWPELREFGTLEEQGEGAETTGAGAP